MVPGLLENLLYRLGYQVLGDCPACGRAVPASAEALRYHGGFYHVACALRHWERSAGRSLLHLHAR